MFFYLKLLIISIFLCELIESFEECSIRDECINQTKSFLSIYNDELLIQNRNCFCDSFCEEYGDCCHRQRSKDPKDSYDCVDFLTPTMDERIPSFSPLSIWMKTKCLPIYFGSNIDQQCRNVQQLTFVENPILFIPVTSLKTNITYRNYYCAFCNNDHQENLEFWEYKTFCSGNRSDNNYLILDNDETVQYLIHNLTKSCRKTIVYPHERGSSEPSVFLRACKNVLPATCPLGTSKELIENCSSPSSSIAYRYIKNTNLIYRNQYCAKCNHPNTSLITCLDPFLPSPHAPLNHIRIHPLSILFDPKLLNRYLNNNTKSRIIYSFNYQCNHLNEFYNLIEKQCSTISNLTEELFISMNCSQPLITNLNLTEDIFYENRSLFLKEFSNILNSNEFIFLDDQQILFCSDRWRNENEIKENFIIFPFYRNILSIILTSISLVCFLLFIFLFFFIESLQNLPGQFLLFLSISQFIGQFTFLISSNFSLTSTACFISAILIHYFYLSSFFWLFFISFQIYSTFHQQTIQRDSNEKNYFRLILFNILVWSSSGILVFISCLIQFLHPQSSFSPAYASIYCSISKLNSMMIFFLVPIGIILILVIFLFSKTILAIYRSRSIAKLATLTTSATSHNNHQTITLINIRLACLMGIQWILLIFALIISKEWFWVIFEIINSLPGVFICLGFLCSKRLFKKIQKRITIKFLSRRQSSRSNLTGSTMITPSFEIRNSRKKPFT